MAETDPLTFNPETVQHVDEEMLLLAAERHLVGLDTAESLRMQQEKIRGEALADAEYHKRLRESVANPVRDTLPPASGEAVERARTEMKGALDPSLPIKFHEAARDQEIARNFDTHDAMDEAYRLGHNPTPQAIEAARHDVQRLRSERTRSRAKIPDPKAPGLSGGDLVAANKELWDAEDRLDILAGDSAGFVTNAELRYAQAKRAYEADGSDSNRLLMEEAKRRNETLSARRDAAYTTAVEKLIEAQDPDHHTHEHLGIRKGHVETSEEDFTKAEIKLGNAKTRLEREERNARFNPGAAALARAQNALEFAQAEYDRAKANRNENREAVEVTERLLNALPGYVTRERIERELGNVHALHGEMNGAIIDLMEATDEHIDASEHKLFVTSYKLHEYITGLDSQLEDMQPTQLNYREIVTMRSEALRLYLRSTFVAEHVKIARAATNPDGFEGRFEAKHVLRDPNRGIEVERQDGKTIIYADGSFSRVNPDGAVGVRWNADGSEWEKGQPKSDEIFGDYEPYLQIAEKVFSKDENVRRHAERVMTAENYEELEAHLYEAWILHQDNPQIAEYAHRMNRLMRERNDRRIAATTDLGEVYAIRAMNSSLDYDNGVINYMSRGNKDNAKHDMLWPNGTFAHIGKHFGREGRWVQYPDGALEAIEFNEAGNVVVLAQYDPIGRRTA